MSMLKVTVELPEAFRLAANFPKTGFIPLF
jgi:hypothetical protein